MRRTRGGLTAVALMFICGVANANITYYIFFSAGGETVSGALATDGNSGAISITDFRNPWALTMTGVATFSISSAGTNAGIFCGLVGGCGLAATSTTLTYNFSLPVPFFGAQNFQPTADVSFNGDGGGQPPSLFVHDPVTGNHIFTVPAVSVIIGQTAILPVSQQPGFFQFNFPTANCVFLESSFCWIDPPVATGYEYSIDAGDPNFASVLLPNIGGSAFTLSYDANGQHFSGPLAAGVDYAFPLGGVADFTVTGISPGANLNPNDPLAFVTGLTFESAGTFTGSVRPLTANVPEPTTLLLLGLGIAALRVVRRTASSSAEESAMGPASCGRG